MNRMSMNQSLHAQVHLARVFLSLQINHTGSPDLLSNMGGTLNFTRVAYIRHGLYGRDVNLHGSSVCDVGYMEGMVNFTRV